MKAITLHQPWASLVAHGHKRVETRSWFTSHRGPLAIHSAKAFPSEARMLCDQEPFEDALRQVQTVRAGELPRGYVLGYVTLADCVPVERVRHSLSERERAFGDYSDGRFAWILDGFVALRHPFRVTGRQRLWELSR